MFGKIKQKINWFILKVVFDKIMKEVEKVERLKGIKTYLVAAAVGVLAVLQHLGYVDASMYATLLGLLGAGGLAALRDGVESSKKK